MTPLHALKVKLFADGADLAGIREMAANPMIRGFTTNPTLMRKAGVADYKSFALQVLGVVKDRPISFEVFDDDFVEMEKQALEIASWGKNVNVKIPVTNTKGEFCGPLVERLSGCGVQLNITAVMTVEQVGLVADRLAADTPAIVSVFAGRPVLATVHLTINNNAGSNTLRDHNQNKISRAAHDRFPKPKLGKRDGICIVVDNNRKVKLFGDLISNVPIRPVKIRDI